MHFAEPKMILLLLLVPSYWVLVWRAYRLHDRRIERVVSKSMRQRLVSPASGRRKLLKLVLISLALAFAALAVARPQTGIRLERVEQKGVDLCIAVDTSRSMLASDVAPTRLQVAKLEIRRLLDGLRGERIALIAFAGAAFLQCPLTVDYGAARVFLQVIDESLIPLPGTNISAAIDLARKKVFAGKDGGGVLVLLTDGEDHSGKVSEAAQRAAREGMRIYTIGFGSTLGSPVPDESGEEGKYKKNSEGEIVLSKLDVSTLQRIAEVTGGRYFHVEAGESALSAVFDEIGALEGKHRGERLRTVYDEQFPMVLLFAILFLALEPVLGVRRRVREDWRGRFQ